MDVEILFADGTFGCTTTREITVSCTWDADGGMAQGRNALPNAFDGNGDDSNKSATSSSARRSKDLRLLKTV